MRALAALGLPSFPPYRHVGDRRRARLCGGHAAHGRSATTDRCCRSHDGRDARIRARVRARVQDGGRRRGVDGDGGGYPSHVWRLGPGTLRIGNCRRALAWSDDRRPSRSDPGSARFRRGACGAYRPRCDRPGPHRRGAAGRARSGATAPHVRDSSRTDRLHTQKGLATPFGPCTAGGPPYPNQRQWSVGNQSEWCTPTRGEDASRSHGRPIRGIRSRFCRQQGNPHRLRGLGTGPRR